MKIQILGDSWEIKVLRDLKFDKLHDKNTEAETDVNKKLIKFRKNCSEETIKHEVSHVIYSYMITLNLNLNLDQQEEFLCEFIEKYGSYIEKLTKKIYNKVRLCR